MKDEELMKKSKTCVFNEDNDLMTTCKAVIANLEAHEENLDNSKEETETYLKMVQNLKPADISKVLTLALKIRESKDIKDPDVKNDASRLIRAIEMS